MTQSKTIRKYCLWCMNHSEKMVAECPTVMCPLYKSRFSKRPKGVRPLKQIRLKCLDCSTFRPAEVLGCEMTDCALHFYRMGKNPRLKGKRELSIGLKTYFLKKSSIPANVL